jgi:hypothetical protein
MKENNPFEGSEYAEALNVLRTIIQQQRYEDFYNGLQVNLLGRDVGHADRVQYYENVVLPFVMDYVIGKRLHGDKLINSWQMFFKDKMSGRSWEETIIDSMAKDADAFAGAVKIIQKNIDEFMKKRISESSRGSAHS